MHFGAHVSIAGGIDKAPINAKSIGAQTFQIFSRSPRGGKPPVINKTLINNFNNELKNAKINNFYIHAPYFINLASSNDRIREGSIAILREELERGSLLGARGMMFHMGSAKDFGNEKSVKLAIDGIKKILKGYKGSCLLLIENSAGAGAILGDTFEEIGNIIKKIKHSKLGVCLDTCHAFASGYDVKDNLNKVVKDFDKHIGLDKLIVLHGNDSIPPLDSHKDRHADIGYGEIGLEAFKKIIKHPKLKHLDFLLETPALKESYNQAIAKLIKLNK